MPASAAVAIFPDHSASAVDKRIKQLPEAAQSKLESLRRTELRSRSLIDGLYERQRHVREHRDALQVELGMHDRQQPPQTLVQKNESTGRMEPAVDAAREAIVSRISDARVELGRLGEEIQAGQPGFSHEDLVGWLMDQPTATRFKSAVVPAIKTVSREMLARVRAEQAKLQERLAVIASTQLTSGEAKAAARAEIDALAQRGRPDVVSGLLNGSGGIAWPTDLLTLNGAGVHPHISAAQVTATFPLLVWANRETIIAALESEIDAQANDASAMTAADRAKAIADAEMALLEAQRREEAIIERLEEQGQNVRRLCRDPLVLLNIEGGQR